MSLGNRNSQIIRGRRGREIQSMLGASQPKSKRVFVVIVVVVYLPKQYSSIMGCFPDGDSQKHLWAPIIGSLVYRPFISFSGNKSHGQTAEACHFRSRFLNRSAPLTFRDRKFLSWGLSWHCRVFSSISGLLDASTKTFTPIMTTKNVSRYFPMFPGGRITPI